MRKITAANVLALTLLALPVLASAQPIPGAQRGLMGILNLLSTILNGLIGVAVTLAIVVFFWGLVKYLFGGGAEGKSDGLKVMFYGVVTIFVMVSVWGLVALLQQTFGVGTGGAPSMQGLMIR